MQFSPTAVIQSGFELFKKRPGFFIAAIVILVIAYIVAGAITFAVNAVSGGSSEDGSFPGQIVNYALSMLISMGYTAFFLAAHDSPEKVEFSALWHPRPFWKYLGASLLASIVIGIGFVLLIVPGIIAMVLFMFTTLVVIDRELGPIEAMKESMRLTEGNRWALLGFILLLMLIFFVGALVFGIGLLVAIPIISLSVMHAYRQLSGAAGQTAIPDASLNN